MKLPKSIDRIPYSELRGENRLALPETFVLLFFACAFVGWIYEVVYDRGHPPLGLQRDEIQFRGDYLPQMLAYLRRACNSAYLSAFAADVLYQPQNRSDSPPYNQRSAPFRMACRCGILSDF